MANEYFSDLNYTLANEDTRIEQILLAQTSKDKVFSISGSGARCLPLIGEHPQEMVIVDMSPTQLFLAELKVQAMKSLSYEEYLFFMGYRGALPGGPADIGNSRLELFSKILISDEASQYWTSRKKGWEKAGFIRLGKWESHFQKIGVLFRDYLQCDFMPIFMAENLEDQKYLFEKHWPAIRWNSFLRLVASEYVFNKFLYKGHFSGQESRRTDQRAPWQMIDDEFKRIFRTQLVRKNYFFQMLFLGRIWFEEGLPLEAHREVYEKVRAAQTRVQYRSANLLEVLPEKSWDFISLSDTISYLDSDSANQILQRLPRDIRKGSFVVIRSFLRAPTKPDTQGWELCEELNQWAYELDGTGVYQFHIFKKK